MQPKTGSPDVQQQEPSSDECLLLNYYLQRIDKQIDGHMRNETLSSARRKQLFRCCILIAQPRE
jgi:hypothetical protein